MSTAISVSLKTKQLMDLVRGERSYNKLIYELVSEKIRQADQP
jgi:hypothetical protein